MTTRPRRQDECDYRMLEWDPVALAFTGESGEDKHGIYMPTARCSDKKEHPSHSWGDVYVGGGHCCGVVRVPMEGEPGFQHPACPYCGASFPWLYRRRGETLVGCEHDVQFKIPGYRGLSVPMPPSETT